MDAPGSTRGWKSAGQHCSPHVAGTVAKIGGMMAGGPTSGSEASGTRERLFIGWDVGAWHCDRKSGSQDALVVLDAKNQPAGRPWRGNLRKTINDNSTASEFVSAVLKLCGIDRTTGAVLATLAIDAPLGFPHVLTRLIASKETVEPSERSTDNPYLFRLTERRLVSEGVVPLSSVKDSIGSQTTKAMHVVAKYCPDRTGVGVWSDNRCLQAIETYPSLCLSRAPALKEAREAVDNHPDIKDAYVCARIARDFVLSPENLEPPVCEALRPSEGWIWAPTRRGSAEQKL